MTIREFREKVNLSLYSSKKAVTLLQRIIMALVTLTAFAALIYYYGFPQTAESKSTLISIFKFSFGVYIFNYILKYIYDFEPYNFFKRTWFEGVLMSILIVEGISYNLFGTLLLSSFFQNFGIDITTYSNVLIQIYFLAIAFYEAGKASNVLPKIRLHPANIFILIFVIIILSGTGLLMLPEMSHSTVGLNFIDALFMSTSATCVTGLATIDISTFLTFKGQVIIMLLIKLGGLNIIAFGSFIAVVAKFGMGIRHHSVLEGFVYRDSVLSAKGMLQRILLLSLFIELSGMIAYYFCWNNSLPMQNEGNKLFFSIFHSLAAFNNAGFSLFSNGFYSESIRNNYSIHFVTMTLMFFGSLGIIAILDIFSWKNIKKRIEQPWRQFSLGTKIALYFSVGLVLFGWFFFFVFESDNTLESNTFMQSLSHSLFQSITARTSGFNTVNISDLAIPTLILLSLLMFIGGSSGSTSGGIKTSTFAILWASVRDTIKGRKEAQIFKRSIPTSLVFKALSIFVIFFLFLSLGVVLLCITEEQILQMPGRTVMDIFFEEISAFSNTGLSTGITPFLTNKGKLIIVVSMFIGKIGMLTVAYAIGKEALSKNYKYPKGHTMIG